MPNPHPTPEQRAEWRRDAEEYAKEGWLPPRAFISRILTLIRALEEAEGRLRIAASTLLAVAQEERP